MGQLLTLLHSERPKLHGVLDFLSAIGLNGVLAFLSVIRLKERMHGISIAFQCQC